MGRYGTLWLTGLAVRTQKQNQPHLRSSSMDDAMIWPGGVGGGRVGEAGGCAVEGDPVLFNTQDPIF